MLLHGWLSCSPAAGGCVPVAGVGILLAGVVVLPGGWWMCPRVWWCLLASSPAYCSRAPRTGVQPDSSARRRNHLNGSLSGFFLIGYSSICQLFKFSYRLLHAKVFTGENFIKTLFSINYRGFFIIQAIHTTINYSYFYIKQTLNM